MFGNLFKKIIIISAFTFLLGGLLPVAVSAQTASNNNQGFKFTDYLNNLEGAAGKATYKTGDANAYFNNLISNIIAVVIGLTGSIFLILIIYSGWQWLTAGGEEEKISQAKNRIKNGVIGLGLCLLAFGITSFVNRFLENKFLTEPAAPPVIETPAGSSLCRTNLDCEDQVFKNCLLPQGICVECLENNHCEPGLSVQPTCDQRNNRCVYFSDADSCSGQSKLNCQLNNSCNWVKSGSGIDDGVCKAILSGPCDKKCSSICYKGKCETECGNVQQCPNTFYTCDGNENICKVLGIW